MNADDTRSFHPRVARVIGQQDRRRKNARGLATGFSELEDLRLGKCQRTYMYIHVEKAQRCVCRAYYKRAYTGWLGTRVLSNATSLTNIENLLHKIQTGDAIFSRNI